MESEHQSVSKPATRSRAQRSEQGQSIVLVAFIFIALIGFVGLAVDVGFVFARRSQLSAAVDSAVLASVTELVGAGGIGAANTKAAQFLSSNNIPINVITRTFDNPGNYSTGFTTIGASEYSLTVTWPVRLFFLRVLGFDIVDVTKSATAAFFPLTDIYASRRVEEGALSTSNQAVFGPHICTSFGDPYSPLNSPYWPIAEGTYNYRILVPPDYPEDIVRVELFDPDSINQDNPSGPVSVQHTTNYIDPDHNGIPNNPYITEGSCSTSRRDACVITTDELDVTFPISPTSRYGLDDINLWWFMRIDENRGGGALPGNGSCSTPGSYTIGYNTATLYELFYYRQEPDGTPIRVDLAHYTGQVGDSRDGAGTPGDHQTDMQWVSPGAPQAYDYPPGVSVPANCGSPTGGDLHPDRCPSGSPPAAGRGFEISIANHLVDILTDQTNGNRYIYMDVTALSGASENGYEIWAGPSNYVATVSSDVNTRNVQVINTRGIHSSRGATVFGIGRLPMNSNYGNVVDIPLIYVGPELGGATIWVSMFDPDSGAQPPIVFYFDSIRFTPDSSANRIDEARTDWARAFGVSGQADPDGVTTRCTIGTTCNNNWVVPAYRIDVPTLTDDCDYASPNPQICTPFYGGRLMAHYQAGAQDTYVWEITMTGLPFLVK